MFLTDAVPHPTFANHESFHLRYGWLKKAYDAALENPKIFVADDALIRLGVGKNMVRSIRFWALACKILEQPSSKPDIFPTAIGRAIFDGKKGLDPYLENPQTLWMLQWLLMSPPCRIPIWWIVLNEFPATNIKISDLTESVKQLVMNMADWKTPSEQSVKKDIDVFVHTYTTDRGNIAIADYLDCPFRQMGMINQASRESIRFVYGPKEGMTPEIAAFACLDFVRHVEIPSKSVSVTRLATEPGSVGNIFKIGEQDLGEMLAGACRRSKSIWIDSINGAPHLVFNDPGAAAEDILRSAYGKKSFRIPRKKTEEPIVA